MNAQKIYLTWIKKKWSRYSNMDNNDNALRDADDNIQSSHELGYFISYQVLHGQLKVAQKKI